MIKWHANSYEVCLYDKVKDLKYARISKKRAVEKDQYSQILYLDDFLANQTQVLRVEIRLQKIKIRTLFKELGIRTPLTLKYIFSSKISKQVITHYWKKITGHDDLLCLLQSNINDQQEYLDNLQRSHPSLKPKDLLCIMGASLALQQIGEAGLRATFLQSQQRGVRRLIEQAKKHQPAGNTRWIATQQIEQKLLRFETTQLENCMRKK